MQINLFLLAACTKQEVSQRPAPSLELIEIATGGLEPGDRAPIIVALHGLGDRPESFARVFDAYPARARVIVPRAISPDGYGGFRWFEARTQDGDEARIARELEAAAEIVARSLEEIEAKHGARPVITGFSQGAMLSFAIAAQHPDRISAAIPIAGWLPPPLFPKTKPKRDPLIRALHGTDDRVVPMSLDRRTCDRLAELGYDVALETYEGVDHTVTAEMHRRWLELLKNASR